MGAAHSGGINKGMMYSGLLTAETFVNQLGSHDHEGTQAGSDPNALEISIRAGSNTMMLQEEYLREDANLTMQKSLMATGSEAAREHKASRNTFRSQKEKKEKEKHALR